MIRDLESTSGEEPEQEAVHATPSMPAAAETEFVSMPRRRLIVRLRGEIDAVTVQVLRDALSVFPPPATIVDVSRITFADCSLVNVLLEARLRRPLVLAGPLPVPVGRLFDLTATATVFTIAVDLDGARALLPRVALTGR